MSRQAGRAVVERKAMRWMRSFEWRQSLAQRLWGILPPRRPGFAGSAQYVCGGMRSVPRMFSLRRWVFFFQRTSVTLFEKNCPHR